MFLSKLLLLLLVLVVGCLFAAGLLFRLMRMAERIAVLQKDLAANDQKLQSKLREVERIRMAQEAAQEAAALQTAAQPAERGDAEQ